MSSKKGKIDQLANQMKQVALSSAPARKKPRRKNKSSVMVAVPAAMSTPVYTTSTRRRKKRASATQGSIVVSRKELIKTVTLEASASDVGGNIILAPSSFTWLAGLAKSFEDYQWQSLRIWWRPAVGTSTSGMIAYGVDWNFSSAGNKTCKLLHVESPKRNQVVALTPSADHAIWQDTTSRSLVLPANLMRTRRWFVLGTEKADLAPGQLAYAATSDAAGAGGKFLGEIWASYSVRLFGTNTV